MFLLSGVTNYQLSELEICKGLCVQVYHISSVRPQDDGGEVRQGMGINPIRGNQTQPW